MPTGGRGAAQQELEAASDSGSSTARVGGSVIVEAAPQELEAALMGAAPWPMEAARTKKQHDKSWRQHACTNGSCTVRADKLGSKDRISGRSGLLRRRRNKGKAN